jgi:hypothetical protein
MMENIQDKLNRYQTYVPGETRTSEYEKQIKQKKSIQDKLDIAETLFTETPFHLTENDKEQVRHLIQMYPNFKELHKRASNETIILAFIYYTKIPNNTDIKLNNYTITRKYNLTHNTFELIICRLALNYLQEVYIIPTEPHDIDHNILYKGEIK